MRSCSTYRQFFVTECLVEVRGRSCVGPEHQRIEALGRSALNLTHEAFSYSSAAPLWEYVNVTHAPGTRLIAVRVASETTHADKF